MPNEVVDLFDNSAVFAEPGGGELPETYRPAASDDVPEGQACGNCAFYDENRRRETDDGSIEVWCSHWAAFVRGDHYCDAWESDKDDEVEASLEEFQDGFVPPQGARTEARRGLEWRKEYNRGGTEVGVARARDISNGASLSASTVKRMVSYFARHEVDKKGQGWSPGQDGYPSAGRIAWALWGGDAGRSWANKTARKIDAQGAASLENESESDDYGYGRKKKRKKKMTMRETFGKMPDKKPEGALRQIVFPELALMGVRTGDGRLLEEDGRGVRALPRTIYGQFQTASGHDGAVPIGSLHEVSFEDGVVSGRGWLIDDENGRKAVQYIQTQTLYHNSIDLSDVRARVEMSEDQADTTLRFTSWKISATTLVGKPAFADARAELLDEEITASWYTDETPLFVDVPLEYNIAATEEELVADGGALPLWDSFHRPESDKPQKIVVDENNNVYGHLALWESCHDGMTGRCVRVPRPRDNYASFNKPGVLTDRGLVETGPIFLSGGHRRAKNGDYGSAYGGIENAWADVRVVAGKHGPWLSGIVRPGVDDDKVYAARASRISGHWLGDRLKAIVSVNAEGFDVPGSGFAHTEYEFALDEDGRVAELVASMPSCVDDDEVVADANMSDISDVDAHKILLELALEDENDE